MHSLSLPVDAISVPVVVLLVSTVNLVQCPRKQGLVYLRVVRACLYPLHLPSILPFSPKVLVLRSQWLRAYLNGANAVAHAVLYVVADLVSVSVVCCC